MDANGNGFVCNENRALALIAAGVAATSAWSADTDIQSRWWQEAVVASRSSGRRFTHAGWVD